MTNLEAPLKVSPLIKLGRWSFLTLGIVYGALNRGRLSKKEAAIREERLRQEKIRDEELAEERKRICE